MGSAAGNGINRNLAQRNSTVQRSNSSSINIAAESSKGSSSFSPVVIAIVGILGAAFLVVSYYTMVAKYCRGRRRGQISWVGRRIMNRSNIIGGINEAEAEEGLQVINTWPAMQQQQHEGVGLEEALIQAIPVVGYYNLSSSTTSSTTTSILSALHINSSAADICAVCLGEFQDAQRLRLLPSCGHAFHLPCIDVWLRSHASCPLCRMPLNSFNITHHAAATTGQLLYHPHDLDPASASFADDPASPTSHLLLAAAPAGGYNSPSPLDNAHYHQPLISGDVDNMHNAITSRKLQPGLLIGPEKLNINILAPANYNVIANKRAGAALIAGVDDDDDDDDEADFPAHFSRCFSTGSSWSRRRGSYYCRAHLMNISSTTAAASSRGSCRPPLQHYNFEDHIVAAARAQRHVGAPSAAYNHHHSSSSRVLRHDKQLLCADKMQRSISSSNYDVGSIFSPMQSTPAALANLLQEMTSMTNHIGASSTSLSSSCGTSCTSTAAASCALHAREYVIDEIEAVQPHASNSCSTSHVPRLGFNHCQYISAPQQISTMNTCRSSGSCNTSCCTDHVQLSAFMSKHRDQSACMKIPNAFKRSFSGGHRVLWL